MNPSTLGSVLAVVGSTISIAGVIANNVFLAHHEAMILWAVSNPLFVGFFFGQYKGWWDGKLSSATYCTLYFIFTITGIYGLWIS